MIHRPARAAAGGLLGGVRQLTVCVPRERACTTPVCVQILCQGGNISTYSTHWEDGSQKKVCRRAGPRCNCKARILWSGLSTVVPLGDRWRWRGDSEPLQLGGEGRDRGSGVRGILFLSKARRLGPHRLGRGTTSKKWGQQGGNSGNWFLAGVGDSAHHTTQLGVISPDSRPSRNPMGRET